MDKDRTGPAFAAVQGDYFGGMDGLAIDSATPKILVNGSGVFTT